MVVVTAFREPHASSETFLSARLVAPSGDSIMQLSIPSVLVLLPLLAACGASFPPPTQRLAEAQSSESNARELKADDEPAAKLSLKLAQEQIAQAQRAMSDGDNKRADGLLIRAKADADLAVAQAREKGAKADSQKAVDDMATQKATNQGQGAVK
jgi:hypothetical protein